MTSAVPFRERWERSDDLYYVVHPMRWAATFAAVHRLGSEARACALVDGAADQAVKHFDRALEDLKRLGVAYQHAHTQVRSAAALAASGERERAAERYVGAYHAARRLGARPLADAAAHGLRGLGESVERRLGRRTARRLDRGGLTRRELQVLRLVSQGHSNRAIARDLFLSPRAVEMHVSNALQKLGCGTRTEAAHRARELGVLA